MFECGQKLYMHDGTSVIFDHIVGEDAYVSPIITVMIQTMDYRGDDVNEEEDEEVAAHFIKVPLNKLTSVKPLNVLDAEIAEKRAVLDALKADTMQAIRDGNRAVRDVKQELVDATRTMDRWREKHQVFLDLGRMLDGETMFPLRMTKNPYHKASDVPVIPKLEDIRLMNIQYKNTKSECPWSVQSEHSSDSYYQIKFFYSEEERQECITKRFTDVCGRFLKKPDYGMEGARYNTGLDYGTLTLWVKKHPHLEIPADITAGKEAFDAEKAQAHRARLKAELDALENTRA